MLQREALPSRPVSCAPPAGEACSPESAVCKAETAASGEQASWQRISRLPQNALQYSQPSTELIAADRWPVGREKLDFLAMRILYEAQIHRPGQSVLLLIRSAPASVGKIRAGFGAS
jgi:hypothetical protein